MLVQNYLQGEELDVAGLNKITVIFDRSASEHTEVGLNVWKAGLDGPPHFHDEKDQAFYVLQGQGVVRLGEKRHDVCPGSLVFIPSGLEHQTITTSEEPLGYLLMNIYESSESKTFAEHIEGVRATRKAQADTQSSGGASTHVSKRAAKFFFETSANMKGVPCFDFGNYQTRLLLDRTESSRMEIAMTTLQGGKTIELPAINGMEQTLFITEGKGEVSIDGETKEVCSGDVVFVPKAKGHVLSAGEEDLVFLQLNVFNGAERDADFAAMYERLTRP